jgi:hypothetical protein
LPHAGAGNAAGWFDGSIEEEIDILKSAAQNGARYVDIEYRYVRPVPPADVIASYHTFEETPADIMDIANQALASGAPIAKVATQVNRWEDNRRLFELLSRRNPQPLIVAGMGDIGQITRIRRSIARKFPQLCRVNGPMDVRQRRVSSSVREMLDTYKFRRIRQSTKLLGILGMPVGHSLSPVLHNRAFEKMNLDFAYVKLPAPTQSKTSWRTRGSVGLSGFSVTIPHKMAVIPFLSRLSPAATAVGAVNTVSDDNGTWIGDNTDVYGVRSGA